MSGWTDARVTTLTSLWAKGLSASQIAKELGGVTRNAVIGKITRLRLPGRKAASPPPRPKPSPRSAIAAKPAPAVPKLKAPPVARHPNENAGLNFKSKVAISTNNQVYETAPEKPLPVKEEAWAPLPGSTPIPIEGLSLKTCKWPIQAGDDQPLLYCGCAPAPGRPYCAPHAAAARSNQQPKTKGKDLERMLRRVA